MHRRPRRPIHGRCRVSRRRFWTPERLAEAAEVKRGKSWAETAAALTVRWRLDPPLTRESIRTAFKAYGHPAPEPVIKTVDSLSGEHIDVVRAVQSGARTLEALCDTLRTHPAEARKRVLAAQKAGYEVQIRDGGLAFDAPDVDAEPVEVDYPGDPSSGLRVAICGDTHIGSQYFLRDEWLGWNDTVYKLGVREILHTGDVFEGFLNWHGLVYELAEIGFDRQAEAVLDAFPEKPGLQYRFITGNHDENSYRKVCGMSPGRALERLARDRGRNDLHFLGAYTGRLQYGSGDQAIKIELGHKKVAHNAQTISLPLQRAIGVMPQGSKPHILALGHLHVHSTVIQRGVYGLLTGTFKAQDPDSREKNRPDPSIGGTVLWAKREGRTIRVRWEWIGAYPEAVHWEEVAV